MPGCEVLGYADDTLIIRVGEIVDDVRSNKMIRLVLRRIDLVVTTEKTEAILFRDKTRTKANPVVRVGEHRIGMFSSMKYLGVMLDSRLTFLSHFKYIKVKMTKVTRALCRLMPNLKGPHECRRRLFAGVLSSVALYGTPIWSDALAGSTVGKRIYRRQ